MIKKSVIIRALVFAGLFIGTNYQPVIASPVNPNGSQARSSRSIVVDWTPGVGDPGSFTPSEQALNEQLARHVYIKRTKDDHEPHQIAWSVRAQANDDYPAQPALFGSHSYPSGVVLMPSSAPTADIVVRLFPTGQPDWPRSFEVVLTDARTGLPVLSTYGQALIAGFGVAGDLKCKVGRADRCATTERLAAGMPASPTSQSAQLLSAFCAPTKIRGDSCLSVPRYPSGPRCNVDLTGNIYSGHFFSRDIQIIVADYRSDCEPHASNFGGLAIFEEVEGRPYLKGFVQGQSASECIVIAADKGMDRLACIESFNGQGQEIASLQELRFTRTSKGYAVSADQFGGAEDNKAAYGMTQVSCQRKQQDLAMSNLAKTPNVNHVSLTITYVDEPIIRQACKYTAATNEANRIADDGVTYIQEGAEKRRVVTFDLSDRRAIRKSAQAIFAK